ncbi:MAG: hypothetical protein KAG56_01395 [Sulfurovaceae bacterium]|nr:hypothetical protein [Sulfurovaceae bacterium]
MKVLQFFIIGFISMSILTGCGVTDDDEGVVKIKNSVSSNTDIKDIYIKRSTTDNWGIDKLKSQELEPGEAKEFTFDKCDRDYDFKVIYLNNNFAHEKDIYVSCYTKRDIVFKD